MIFSVITVASYGSLSYANAVSSKDNLTKVFDCINQKAVERTNLSLVDAFVCYDKELPGAVKYSGEPYQNPDLSSLVKIQPVSFNSPDLTNTDDKGEDKSDAKTTSILKPSDKGEDKIALNPTDNNDKINPNTKISKPSDAGSGIHLSQESSGIPNKNKITKQFSDPIDTVKNTMPQSQSPLDSSISSIDTLAPQSKSTQDSITSTDPSDLIPLVLPFSDLGSE